MIHIKLILLIILLVSVWSGIMMAKLYGKGKRVDAFDRWIYAIFIILANGVPLYVFGATKNHPEYTTLTQIMDTLDDKNSFEMFEAKGVFFKFLIILALSIVPIIMICWHKENTKMFDVIKPVVSTFSVLATILLFLVKTTKGANVNDYEGYIYYCYNLTFGVYPLTLAFGIGEYVIKLQKLKSSKEDGDANKDNEDSTVRKRPRRKPKWR